MRTISATSLVSVTEQFGEEPINIVEIQWTTDGPRLSYADRDLDGGNIKGRITEISGLDFIINVSEGSDSAEISLALSDVDGDLKSIIDAVDIHKKDVWVYQWFEGLDTAEKFLIFRGEINSEIIWNEGDRTLKFSVISKIEDAEIGFSIEEGQFNNPSPDMIGKAWPLKFGTTINVPALKYESPRRGTLATGVGISDFTLPYRISESSQVTCPLVFRGFRGEYIGNSFFIRPVFTSDEGCVLNRCTVTETLKAQLKEQQTYEFDQITINDGDLFPQGVEITLDIEGAKFTGSFDGTDQDPSTTFIITSREHPEFDEIGALNDDVVNKILKDQRDEAVSINCGGAGGGLSDGQGGTTSSISHPPDPSRSGVESSEKSHEFFAAIPTSSFFWAQPGSVVTLDTGDEVIYASNLVPETVTRVAAFRTIDGVRRLATVPPSLYTVRTTDFNSYMVSEIVFVQSLNRESDDWEDDIYVTSISTVGPNTVNIMEWLIAKYTDLDVDSTSFDYVRAKLEVYPMDFPYLDRRNILDALQELAFQARCAIYLRDGIFFLKYLPELASAVGTFIEDDVDANTLELFHSSTEDIVTKFIAEWKRDYSIDDPNTVILRHNVSKYGTQEETFDFYAYNELPYIHKSATFWLIRKSNTWRQLRFNTPLQHLALETFDTADVTLPDAAPGTIPALIEKANYDSNNQALTFELWTPVRSGTTTVYDFAHPANIDSELQWPTDEDRDESLIGSGDAPGFTTFAPDGHPLSSSVNLASGFSLGPCASQGSTVKSFEDQTCGNGNGDTYPSDTDDTAKEKQVDGGTPPGDSPVEPGEINVGDGPLSTFGGETDLEKAQRTADTAEKAARQAQSTANEANEEVGGEGSSTNPDIGDPDISDLPSEDELKDNLSPEEGRCLFFTDISVHKAIAVYQDGEIAPQPTGYLGNSNKLREDRIIFKTCSEAQRMSQAVRNSFLARQAAADIGTGEELAVAASAICPLAQSDCEGCEEEPVPIGFDSPDSDPNVDYMDDVGNHLPAPIACP